jgi:hypothetical protein
MRRKRFAKLLFAAFTSVACATLVVRAEDKKPAAAAGATTKAQPATAPTTAPTTGPAVKTAAEERTVHKKPKDGEVYAVTIQELGNFDYDQEKGGNIPKDVTELNGVTVRLPGFMIPLDQADKIKQFVLVPDLFACCFGQPPQVQHGIIVNCPEGKAVSYYPEQIVVEGKLSVQEKKDDGFIISIFEVAVNSVKPAPK